MDREAAIRIDKWLWAARFFKTRAVAARAIAGGKVELNGQRVKAAKEVHPGDELTIHIGPFDFALRILALSGRRGPAAEAALLYREHAESKAVREALAARLRAERAGFAPAPKRPGKRARREIIRFKQGSRH